MASNADATTFDSSVAAAIAVEGGSGGAPSEYASTRTTTDLELQRIQQRGRSKAPVAPPAITAFHALAEQQSAALEAAQRLEMASALGEFQDAAVAGIELSERLSELWRLRHLRSDDWATVVNKLQVAISQEEFERFTREQAMAVRMAIETHLRPDADNDDIQAATVLLQRSGLRPWKILVDQE